MDNRPFETPLTLSGPCRKPKQMLAEQYGDEKSTIHDDDVAEKLGFVAGPIEGPTHFSQFVPLLAHVWGREWFETGCLSAHYQNMVVEGEEVKAFVELPQTGETQVSIHAEKADGTPVLTASASVGKTHGPSLLEERMAKLRPPEHLIMLRDLKVGDKGAEIERVKMDFDQYLGVGYPFTLRQKLGAITENSPWYTEEGGASPWGRPIIPLEMVCVLCQYTAHKSGFRVRQPSVGLFADLEIAMHKGPLFVGQEYLLEREVVALGESRRTEGSWVRTLVRDCDTNEVLAHTLLHNAIMKKSFPGYDEELAALQ